MTDEPATPFDLPNIAADQLERPDIEKRVQRQPEAEEREYEHRTDEMRLQSGERIHGPWRGPQPFRETQPFIHVTQGTCPARRPKPGRGHSRVPAEIHL